MVSLGIALLLGSTAKLGSWGLRDHTATMLSLEFWGLPFHVGFVRDPAS